MVPFLWKIVQSFLKKLKTELLANLLLIHISYFSSPCDRITDINNLNKEKFILAYSFRGFHPWLFSSMHLGRVSWKWECVEEGIVRFILYRNQRKREVQRPGITI
jgi:hypothetical protein